MIVTFVVQSSSISVGMIIALVSAGLVGTAGAIPLILGTNIGTCITAMLASIGATISAKRAAAAHVLFNVAGTVLALILLPFYYHIVLLI